MYDAGKNGQIMSFAEWSSAQSRPFVTSHVSNVIGFLKSSEHVMTTVRPVALTPTFSICVMLLPLVSICDELMFLLFKMNLFTKPPFPSLYLHEPLPTSLNTQTISSDISSLIHFLF